jgi:hypothetical protein
MQDHVGTKTQTLPGKHGTRRCTKERTRFVSAERLQGITLEVHRVGQNRINTPYMTVCMVISLPTIPYIHRIYTVLANPRSTQFGGALASVTTG